MRFFLMLAGSFLATPLLQAQEDPCFQILTSLDRGSVVLRASRAEAGFRERELTVEHRPSPLAFDAYYLPFGSGTGVDYVEWQFSQEFSFPGVSGARKAYRADLAASLDHAVAGQRQSVFLQAVHACIDIQYWQTIREEDSIRLQRAREVLRQVEVRQKEGAAGKLEVDEALWSMLRDEDALALAHDQVFAFRQRMEMLHGGIPLPLPERVPINWYPLPGADSLWREIQLTDPSLMASRATVRASEEAERIARRTNLPGWRIGVNQQGIPGDRYTGVFGGLSLPLWNMEARLEAARLATESAQWTDKATRHEREARFRTAYRHYVTLTGRLDRHREAVHPDAGMRLLEKSYLEGAISYLVYHKERETLRQRQARIHELEWQCRRLRAELLQHRW